MLLVRPIDVPWPRGTFKRTRPGTARHSGGISVAELLEEGPLDPQQAALIGFEAARLAEGACRAGRLVRLCARSLVVDAEARVRLAGDVREPGARRLTPGETTSRAVRALGELLAEMLACTQRSHEALCPRARELAAISARATTDDPELAYRSIRQFAHDVGAFLLEEAPRAVV